MHAWLLQQQTGRRVGVVTQRGRRQVGGTGRQRNVMRRRRRMGRSVRMRVGVVRRRWRSAHGGRYATIAAAAGDGAQQTRQVVTAATPGGT